MELKKQPLASYDLHLHTFWSYDGCTSVEYYFQRALELKLRAIAITEHFTMDSLPDIITASKKYPAVRFIPSVEMTVTCSVGAVDILCFGMPLEIPTEIEEIFERYRQWQRDCGEAFSRGMTELGFNYSKNERLKLLKKYRPANVIEKQGVTHVYGQSAYFINAGYIKSGDDAKLLKEKIRIPEYPQAREILPAFKRCGALIAIAHPTHYFNRNDIERMDELRDELSFEGIECAHDLIPMELTHFYRDYCLKHGLFSSGGSDSHSDPDNPKIHIGTQHEFARHIGEQE
ncbi:MAG: PHP domain protein [Candidatus Uhrbacteria bacterium GW2011_GWF2_39_13]|uniref:PHP domain protein n=1 Tax=Candidatus Uhrbacteria bacterium GW2011_GWF2_39_13 TaxID=1618995 RepID=A0A0G0Q1U0_9BACT|nr:MAG: PHP domain protein [Candidatus Uhrbacteria bacterium GW2011_GWF2_39_13]